MPRPRRGSNGPFRDPAPWFVEAQYWSDPTRWDSLAWYAPEWCRNGRWNPLSIHVACHAGAWCMRAVRSNKKNFKCAFPLPWKRAKPLPKGLPLCFRVTHSGDLKIAWEVLDYETPPVPFCFYLPPNEVDPATRAALVEEIQQYINLHPILRIGRHAGHI